MSTAFEDDFKAAAVALVEVLGEPITYTPKGGVAVTVNAIVTRNPPQSAPGPAGNDVRTPMLTVQVPNAATPDGIPLASLNAGGDTIRLELIKGAAGSAQTMPLGRPVEQEDGLLVFEF